MATESAPCTTPTITRRRRRSCASSGTRSGPVYLGLRRSLRRLRAPGPRSRALCSNRSQPPHSISRCKESRRQGHQTMQRPTMTCEGHWIGSCGNRCSVPHLAQHSNQANYTVLLLHRIPKLFCLPAVCRRHRRRRHFVVLVDDGAPSTRRRRLVCAHASPSSHPSTRPHRRPHVCRRLRIAHAGAVRASIRQAHLFPFSYFSFFWEMSVR